MSFRVLGVLVAAAVLAATGCGGTGGGASTGNDTNSQAVVS